ncbi:unnamed protein product [Bemisia tabaci]|uniref:Arb2 domain-containing protein n=1 Tax=Bemisia tabaci TaxID=7038 RepID=A0A9P0A396_BEMTA|nr:PREDICTED: protein FAM172A [Bemisia tabaci]XP_018906082.1 PREDICTED: protein FAM172A [Bemisia tabaci]CAH0382304.1 unnamed protein product [Bemisia tabaci]
MDGQSTSDGRTTSFPTTIRGFGYDFNEDGKLRKMDQSGKLTDVPYDFNVSSDHTYNQRRYEALGELITEHIYVLLEKEGLQKLPVPKDSAEEEGSFIYCTKNALKKENLMLLIHGNGVVRVGQWARSLIINESIDSGSMLPYIRKAKELGFGVICFNTNDNWKVLDGKKSSIKGSESPEEHAISVWKDYIQPSKAANIALVGHSYGGVVIFNLISHFEQDFMNRVFVVALTDSVHHQFSNNSHLPSSLQNRIFQISRNWVKSTEPLDAPIRDASDFKDVTRVSAGTPKHEMTSWSCMESLFNFVMERLPLDSRE